MIADLDNIKPPVKDTIVVHEEIRIVFNRLLPIHVSGSRWQNKLCFCLWFSGCFRARRSAVRRLSSNLLWCHSRSNVLRDHSRFHSIRSDRLKVSTVRFNVPPGCLNRRKVTFEVVVPVIAIILVRHLKGRISLKTIRREQPPEVVVRLELWKMKGAR
jgi:hypothetical protein